MRRGYPRYHRATGPHGRRLRHQLPEALTMTREQAVEAIKVELDETLLGSARG